MKLKEATDFLTDIGKKYHVLGEGQRSGSFLRAANSIRTNCKVHEFNSVQEIEELQKLAGVGNSTITELVEYFNTGTSQRYQDITERSKEVISNLSTSDKCKDILGQINGLKKK